MRLFTAHDQAFVSFMAGDGLWIIIGFTPSKPGMSEVLWLSYVTHEKKCFQHLPRSYNAKENQSMDGE